MVYRRKRSSTFERGKLVIPIREIGDYVDLFFVCPGLDENDNIPSWAVDVSLKDIGLNPLPSEFPEEKEDGLVSLRKSDLDAAFIPFGQEINYGDFIRVRSKYYKVFEYCRHNKEFNCVRFKTDIDKNANHANYG